MNTLPYSLAKELKDAGYPQRQANGLAPHGQYTGYGLGFVYPEAVARLWLALNT